MGIMVNIERQTFVYCHVYLLSDRKLIGYVANHFGTRKLTFLGKKSTFELNKKNQMLT